MISFYSFFLLVSMLPFRATVDVYCNSSSTYAVNSTYQANLNILLSSLTAKSSSSINNNTTIGTSGDRIYGIYLCQGDLSQEDCQACVQTASTNIIASVSCPSSRQTIIWDDLCMLRYSDLNFFGIPDTTGLSRASADHSSTSLVLYQMVSNLVHVAPFRLPMFASNASTSTSSYAMAQCTDDLTPAGCSKCLSTILSIIKKCCLTSIRWTYLSASCSIRYEDYPFLRSLNGTYDQIVESTCSANNLPTSNQINTLLSDITSKAAPTGFYNDTQSKLFGLALCRADIPVPSDDCNNCLALASTTLTTKYCHNNTQGTVWYEKCMVRYSDESFFGVVDYGGKSYCGVEDISNDAGSNNVAFVTSLVGVAANKTQMFAANATLVGSSQPGYALVQCGKDLSSEGCKSCLQKGMSVVSRDCKQKNGWRYLSGSCTIRYEEFAFFDTSAFGIGALAPTFAPLTGGEGKQKSSKKVAVILGSVLVPIVVGTLLYLSCWILKKRNAKRVKLGEGGLRHFGLPSNMDFPFVDLAIIQTATGNFSDANKLGEGGFGPVYKGTLSNE